MDTLEDHVLVRIFSFLNIKDWPTIQQVCKRWEKLMLPFWETIDRLEEIPPGDEPYKTPRITRKKLYSIAKFAGPFIKTLCISSNKFHVTNLRFGKFAIAIRNFYNESVLIMIYRMFGNITNMNFQLGYFEDDLLLELILTNKNIKTLALGTCSLKPFFLPNITYDSVEDVSLNLNSSYGVENFHWPFSNAKVLRLSINYMHYNETNKILQKILPFAKKLKFLVLDFKIVYIPRVKTVVIPALSYLSEMIDLETIILTVTGEQLSDDFVVAMTQNCKMLKDVELHLNIKENSLAALLSMPQLETLILDEISNFSKENVVLSKLKTFSVKICLELVPEDFEHLRETIRDNMPELEHISVFNLLPEQSVILTIDTIDLAMERFKEAFIFEDRYNPLTKFITKNDVPDDCKLQIIITQQSDTYLVETFTYARRNYRGNTVHFIRRSNVPYIRVSLPLLQLHFDDSLFENN